MSDTEYLRDILRHKENIGPNGFNTLGPYWVDTIGRREQRNVDKDCDSSSAVY